MKSIEMRVREAMDDLTLILAALRAPNDSKWYGRNDREAALAAAARRAHGELYWLTTLPPEILKTDAPDDDEREGAER